jgi:hypothetical protein
MREFLMDDFGQVEELAMFLRIGNANSNDLDYVLSV